MSRFFKSAAFPILIVVVLAFFAQKLIGTSGHAPRYTYGNLVQEIQGGQVKSMSLDPKSDVANVTLTQAAGGIKYSVGYPDNAASTLVSTWLKDGGDPSKIDVKPKSTSGWLSLLTYILPFIIFIGFWIFLMNQDQGGGRKEVAFGQWHAWR